MYVENKLGDSSIYFSAKSLVRSSIKEHFEDKDIVYQNAVVKQYEINDNKNNIRRYDSLFNSKRY